MFKRKQRPARPAPQQTDTVPAEDKAFNNADGRVSMSRPQWPDDGKDDFGGDRLNTLPSSLGLSPLPPD